MIVRLRVNTTNIPDSGWINEFVEQLPSLTRVYIYHNKHKRQLNRCYQHVISLTEFMLFVKLHGWGNNVLRNSKVIG